MKRAPKRGWRERSRRALLPLVSAVLLAYLSPASAQPVGAPDGWTVSKSGANWVYTPAPSPPDGTFSLTVEPPEALAGQDLNAWLATRIQMDLARRGVATKAAVPQPGRNGLLSAVETYRDRGGRNWTVMYVAVPVSAGQTQLGYMQADIAGPSEFAYFRMAGVIFGKAVAAGRASPTPSAPMPASDSQAATTLKTERTTTPTSGSSPLAGLYLRAQFQVMLGMGSRYDWYFYLFGPNGHVYNGFPSNGMLDHFDFAAAAARDPKNTGAYRISGNRIEFTWGGGRKPESSSLVFGADEVQFLGEHWRAADTDPRKQARNWLLGTFRYQMAVSVGGSSGIHQTWYTFGSDGAFQSSASAAVLSGAPVPQANRSTASQASGTFHLDGTTLTLEYADGRRVQHTVFPYGKAIFLDGMMFIHP